MSNIWKKPSEKPHHRESIFMLFVENEFIISGFYNDPEESDSILTGFCRWAEKGKSCLGIINFDYWCYASDLIASLPLPPTMKDKG